MPLSDRQIAGAAAQAGFTGSDLVTAVAVALAESGGNPRAVSSTGDYGLWQINRVHAELLASGDRFNPADNARMAYRVWMDAGRSWRPWVAYTTGRHLAYVGRARKAAGNPRSSTGGMASIPVGSPSVNASVLTAPGTWLRVAMFLAGGMLLVWSLLSLTKLDNTLAKVAITRKVLR